jgi:hypothetical protein
MMKLAATIGVGAKTVATDLPRRYEQADIYTKARGQLLTEA